MLCFIVRLSLSDKKSLTFQRGRKRCLRHRGFPRREPALLQPPANRFRRGSIESSGVAGAELEDLTSLPRSIEGVEVGLTYRQQRDGSFRISVRTSGSIDACNIARRLGGGGHTRAAGCEISGNLDNAKHAVLEEVRKELQRCGLLDQDAG